MKLRTLDDNLCHDGIILMIRIKRNGRIHGLNGTIEPFVGGKDDANIGRFQHEVSTGHEDLSWSRHGYLLAFHLVQ